MSKRKKHRRTKAQKKARLQRAFQANTSKENPTKLSAASTNISAVESPTTETLQGANINYIKSDIRRSLMLIGIILIVFAVLFVVLEKTSIGNSVFSLIKL